MTMSRAGNIRQTSLPDILEDLRQRKATGTLTVKRGAVSKSIYVNGGQIVFATSTEACDRLGEILVKTGKLTAENLVYALQLFNMSGGAKKLGAILVENKLISPKDLFAGQKIQVKDIIYSLFLLQDGEFLFEERLPADILQLPINFQELLAEIIERMRYDA